jgi:hypothetical protein
VKATINSMQARDLRRNAFQWEHLPGIIPEKTSGSNDLFDNDTFGPVTVSTELVSLATSSADIVNNWDILATLNGGGAFYNLPPCKVLVWASFEMSEWDTGGSNSELDGQQAWAALTYKVNGGLEVLDMTDVGFVLSDVSISTNAWEANHPLEIMTIIDMTAHVGPWVLNYVRLRAAKGRGYDEGVGADNTLAYDWVALTGNIGFIAAYRDDV